MFSMKFVKFYRILFLQKTAGRLLSISCNISDISLALLTINQLSNSWLGSPQRDVRKHFTVFVSKVFKTTKIEGNYFCGCGQPNKQKKVFSRSSHPESSAKKRSEIFGKTHRKTPAQESFFSLYAWNFSKKRLLHRCFPIKFIRAAFFVEDLLWTVW